jgi:hypothetical protein
MKKFLLSLPALCTALLGFAQARYTTTEFQKVMRPAIVADMPFPEKTVSNAIEDKMNKSGYKGKSVKSFTMYSGVHLNELGVGNYDMYYLVDRVSRKDKGNSTVTLMLSKGFDAFVSDSSDASVIESAKNYMNNLRDMVAAYDLEMQITEQEDVIKKADKKYNSLVDDGTDLQKKKRKIEEQIVENTAAQAVQKGEAEKQRQVLETLKAKRKI